MNYPSFSVLMSVYIKEKPEYLRESILSVLNQTALPDEIVLVKDGPLTIELEAVINEFIDNDILKIVEIKENVGLGKALNKGLLECRNGIIARMDTDDIAKPERFEKQLEYFKRNSDLSVLGSAVEEFIDNPNNILAYNTVKTEYEIIKKTIKFRNPIIHPTVMFKKEDVISSGNYKDWNLNEDYYLWIRMIQNNYVFKNINEPLVSMRITNETYLRRGGWRYFITQKRLFDYMLKSKMINTLEYLYNNGIRFVARVLLPNKVRKILYLRLLRKK